MICGCSFFRTSWEVRLEGYDLTELKFGWSGDGFTRISRIEPLNRSPDRFMESPHDFDAVQWDHEPRQLVGRGVLTAPRPGGGLGTARPTSRFMESAGEKGTFQRFVARF